MRVAAVLHHTVAVEPRNRRTAHRRACIFCGPLRVAELEACADCAVRKIGAVIRQDSGARATRRNVQRVDRGLELRAGVDVGGEGVDVCSSGGGGGRE